MFHTCAHGHECRILRCSDAWLCMPLDWEVCERVIAVVTSPTTHLCAEVMPTSPKPKKLGHTWLFAFWPLATVPTQLQGGQMLWEPFASHRAWAIANANVTIRLWPLACRNTCHNIGSVSNICWFQLEHSLFQLKHSWFQLEYVFQLEHSMFQQAVNKLNFVEARWDRSISYYYTHTPHLTARGHRHT